MAKIPENITSCVLRSRNYKFRDVHLPDNTPITVGRGPQTKIRERRCSKNQVQITANYQLRKAIILQVGANPSEVDRELLCAEESTEVIEGSSINLLKDDLKYTLEFLVDGKLLSPKKSPITKESGTPLSPFHANSKRTYDDSPTSSKKIKQDGENDAVSDDESPRQDITSKLASMRDSLADDLRQLTTDDKWEEYDHSKLLIFTPAGLRGKSKVAAFDMDHTIICTKSGKVFPTNTDDWRIMYAEIPGKLKDLYHEGYKIVIFTNQKGISRGKTSVTDFKRKVKGIVHRLGIPIQVMVSTGSGRYRKPNTGMWDYFLLKGNQGITVDVGSCIYIGDAAGRIENWAPKKKKDFSCADRLFALNVQLKFSTPEEFFLGQKTASFRMPSFDPRSLNNGPLAVRFKPSSTPEITIDEKDITSTSPEVVVCVGFPASGKTHFVEKYLVPKGYAHVNRDILGSWQKCVAECSKALSRGKSVVIDNTNPDTESRKRYIECAQQAKIPCRCFLFACALEQAKHNNVYRELLNPDKKHVGVNDMVLNSYKGKYKEPILEEGFIEILKVNFIPKFKNRHEEKLFRKFLIEK